MYLPVAAPFFCGNEERYVLDALRSGEVSSVGSYVARFESAFARYCDVPFATACSGGTSALHLALRALDVGPGDEVILPTLTFVAAAHAIAYCGAKPVFVDSEPSSWNLDVAQVTRKINARTKAILAVHLYGTPVDFEPLLKAANGIPIVEDVAQAQGARYRGRLVGTLGDIAAFSFSGGKIMTTGEGGMVLTRHEHLFRRVRKLNAQGMEPDRKYWFSEVGYNYRMTNLSAALGLAQLEQLETLLARRQEVFNWYTDDVGPGPKLPAGCVGSPWLFTLSVSQREELRALLQKNDIDSRPVFHPLHTLPPYADGERYPVAEQIAANGLSLPTWIGLKRDDVRRITALLLKKTQSFV